MPLNDKTLSLINFYEQKIDLDNSQLEQLKIIENKYNTKTGTGLTNRDQITVYGPEETLSYYDYPIKQIDKKIVEINTQINALQNSLAVVASDSVSSGCGTTSAGITTVYRDDLTYQGFKYEDPNPFETKTGSITVSNAGIGTINKIVKVGISSYYNNTETCYDPLLGCGCDGFASSITTLESQIVELQNERKKYINKVNDLKEFRIEVELQNYAYKTTRKKLKKQIQKSEKILNFLKNPDNAEFL